MIFRNNLYVIGTSNHINLNIKLKNNQEPAYDVGVKVHSNLLLVDNEDNFYQKWEINQNNAEMDVDTFFGANFEVSAGAIKVLGRHNFCTRSNK